ncbi:MAG: FAA hydrolase family protein [Trueperaceae bacterium]|nr:MAG: FAA hydrolase family protein [Trueperaceae bacterium]
MTIADVVPALHTVRVPVADDGGASRTFPVRRIFCVGRNYAEHAREMGHDPTREAPFFFTKPADAVVGDGAALPFPTMTEELHHEVELVVAIGTGGDSIPVERALDHVFGYAVGLDMTRRDIQRAAKESGRPWDLGKGFDRSAPCSAIMPVATIGHLSRGSIRLTVNGEVRQDADLSDLIWSVPEIVSDLSRFVRLEPGDLIMTGTPAGVGPVHHGDELVGAIEGVGTIRVTYEACRYHG